MAHIVNNFNKALRRQARGEQQPPSARELAQLDIDGATGASAESQQPPPQQPSVAQRRSAEHIAEDNAEPAAKRLKSPSTSAAGDAEGDEQPGFSTPAHMGDSASQIPRPVTKGKLWTEGDPALTRSNAAGVPTTPQHKTRGATRRHNAARPSGIQAADEKEPASVTVMVSQPDTRPISQDQLVAEVKGIYAGLVMVESKCIEVDTAQSAQADSTAKLNNEQWQALIALHRTLLHEHHDFFLASQHPSASPALLRLSQKYAMPARMWRHGIHSFLELLRARLPASLEHMLTFIYLAYSMMALLYETVPSFEDTWIECLGDLGRYRMAIEDEDIRDREIWTGVSRHWYAKASDRAPTTGRLYHHLAILSRPNAFQQLSYYSKSLCVAFPFKSARDSILTLFDPILNSNQHKLPLLEFTFVKSHAILFIVSNTNEEEKPLPNPVDQMMAEYNTTKTEFIACLDHTVSRSAKGWNTVGGQMGISNNNAILEYGKTDANAQGDRNVILATLISKTGSDVPIDGSEADSTETDGEPVPSTVFNIIRDFVKDCDCVMFNRYGDNKIMSYLHIRLAFMYHMARIESAMKHVEHYFPWTQVVRLLNLLVVDSKDFDCTGSEEFPRPTERPLPEDWTMRGHLWVEDLYPSGWFNSDKIEEDEKSFELPSMREHRRTRILWLGRRLASFNKWIIYDKESKQFQANNKFNHQAECTAHSPLPQTATGVTTPSTADSTATMADETDDLEPGGVSSMVVEDAD